MWMRYHLPMSARLTKHDRRDRWCNVVSIARSNLKSNQFRCCIESMQSIIVFDRVTVLFKSRVFSSRRPQKRRKRNKLKTECECAINLRSLKMCKYVMLIRERAQASTTHTCHCARNGSAASWSSPLVSYVNSFCCLLFVLTASLYFLLWLFWFFFITFSPNSFLWRFNAFNCSVFSS